MKQSEVHALKGKWVCKLKIHHLPLQAKGWMTLPWPSLLYLILLGYQCIGTKEKWGKGNKDTHTHTQSKRD